MLRIKSKRKIGKEQSSGKKINFKPDPWLMERKEKNIVVRENWVSFLVLGLPFKITCICLIYLWLLVPNIETKHSKLWYISRAEGAFQKCNKYALLHNFFACALDSFQSMLF